MSPKFYDLSHFKENMMIKHWNHWMFSQKKSNWTIHIYIYTAKISSDRWLLGTFPSFPTSSSPSFQTSPYKYIAETNLQKSKPKVKFWSSVTSRKLPKKLRRPPPFCASAPFGWEAPWRLPPADGSHGPGDVDAADASDVGLKKNHEVSRYITMNHKPCTINTSCLSTIW